MILDTTRPRRALSRRALLLALGLSAAALVPLAVLRPGARVQAAAPAASQGHRNAETIYYLPAGVPLAGDGLLTVQLSGVADPAARRWWRADGTPSPQALFDVAPASHFVGLTDPKQRRILLAFRLPADAQDVTVKYDLTDCLFSSSVGTWRSKMQSTSQQTETQLNAQTNGAQILTAIFPASVAKTDVRVGTASGPWKVIATARRDASGRIEGLGVQMENAGYIFSPLTETKEGAMLTISASTTPLSSVVFHPNKRTGGASFHIWQTPADSAADLRVVAVDPQGRKVLPADIGDHSIGALDQITAHFSLPPAQIKEVRLESRPFHYVEFKSVALRPAH